MRRQYHGWEYSGNGQSACIPEPKNFAPLDENRPAIPAYRLAVCGQLVFVSVAQAGPSLQDFLGDFFPILVDRFEGSWRISLSDELDYAANWNVPVENSLEAYHVPNVHPQTFKVNPDEKRSQHALLSRRTGFGTHLPFSPHSRIDALFQKLERVFVRSLGVMSTGEYWQHHFFPNLLFSFTDAISLCHCVVPVTAETSRGIVRQFGRTVEHCVAKRNVARVWGWLAGQITRRILMEDLRMFPAIQRGLRSSPHQGILARCEERIHAFQKFVHQVCYEHLDGAAQLARD